MTLLLLQWSLAGDIVLPTDPLGVRALLASSVHQPGWACASACIEDRCGWVCDGPGNGWPESAAWTRFQRERGGGRFLMTEHEGASWRRMTHVGYDSPDQAALREVLEAALSMTRAATTW